MFLLTGCDAMKPTPFNFTTLQRDEKPNSYLVCPKDYCHTKVDEVAPIFKLNVIDLQKKWQDVINQQARIEVLTTNKAEHDYQYVQRSLLLRFPDIINVKLISVSSDTSTIAIYSSAVYGYYDFNVNKKRVQNWLNELRDMVNKQDTKN
jgi:uncharacterized protein (DUF1499 family)